MTSMPGLPGPEWLDAKAIVARAGGERDVGTVRSWWKRGLAYAIFDGLSTKSNKRSHRDDVDAYLRSQNITPRIPSSEARGSADGAGGATYRQADSAVRQPRLADVLDALVSVKAAADAALDAVIVEAEAAAQQAATRIATYKKLRTVMHGYDMALSVLVQPDTPPSAGPNHSN